MEYEGNYVRLVDFESEENKKRAYLLNQSSKENTYVINQQNFRMISRSPFAYWLNKSTMLDFQNNKCLEDEYYSCYGLLTGHDEGFIFCWYEVNKPDIIFDAKTIEEFRSSERKYAPLCKGGVYKKWYGNRDLIVRYDHKGIEGMSQYPKYASNGIERYFSEGITWAEVCMGNLSVRYMPNGNIFSLKGPCMFANDKESLMYAIGYLNTKVVHYFIQILNPTISCGTGVLNRLPIKQIDVIDSHMVEENISLSKEDWDSFETSWDFKEHPLVLYSKGLWDITYTDACLHHYYGEVAQTGCPLERCYLLWQGECNERFNTLKDNEEELNRIFIDIYGLQEEINPEVEDKDITVRRADFQRDIKSLISYAVGCMFGRYSLVKEGLVYAGGEFDETKYGDFLADKDAIIPITDETYFEDDIVGRFEEFIKTVFGADSLEENLNYVANALGTKGTTSREKIRNYFINDFFKDHCNTYSVTGSGKRPIYWLFDSGKQNGFKCLIYLHRYDKDTVGKIRSDYLVKVQSSIENALKNAEYIINTSSSATDKAQALKKQDKYIKQLAEIKAYYPALSHIALQKIELDLDDGVKVNYEKFQNVEVVSDTGKKQTVNLLAKI